MTEVKVAAETGGKGLTFERFFTKPGIDSFDTVEWELRDASITKEKGEKVFEQKAVEVPKSWSQSATNIAVSKYFRGKLNTPLRETSIRQLIGRVSNTMSDWGINGGYFATKEDADTFRAELTYLLIHQMACFNSPVWFNVGWVKPNPQCSACFILDVKDDMQSILNLVVTEGTIFKFGSGSGINLSSIRSERELLSGGGKASGPLSFMRGFDSFAGAIKSGGATRRAACMRILNIDHPDIAEFIEAKAKEEKKAWALIDAGYDGTIDGDAYHTVQYQNANHSIRVTDEFMRAVLDDRDWKTRFVTTGDVADVYRARELMKKISDAAWTCADPGMQYDTIINRWHTCPNSDRIYASNPCSEFMFINNSSCNLASLNLLKFLTEDGEFNIVAFKKAVEIITTAQEIIVDNAGYPTADFTRNSKEFRPLGLGYANLGALLMTRGLPYDSDAGRNFAAAITSLMTGWAYRQSTLIAKEQGPFAAYELNREPMLHVINMHKEAASRIDKVGVPPDLLDAARNVWDEAIVNGKAHGFRNAQATLLAPTGTIGFMMDCDTTGIEPDMALVKYKWLVGGGMMKIVNRTVPAALKVLGYTDAQVRDMLTYIDQNDTIEGAPHLRDEHLPVFDCAFKPAKGKRTIHYLGHIQMMAAVQPFISGAISKTVNVPHEITPEEISDIYMKGWQMGLKAIAIYRDGSKRTQPLTITKDKAREEFKPIRRHMPNERVSVTHKFNIAGHEGYITVGMFDDGKPGEIFVRMSKAGSTIAGLMDCFAISVSMALQYGVPLPDLVQKYIHTRFDPSGVTNNKEIRFARSIMDYIFRWMALRFLNKEDLEVLGMTKPMEDDIRTETNGHTVVPKVSATPTTAETTSLSTFTKTFEGQADAPPCFLCGAMMVRNGNCYKCLNCGSTSGCS